MVAYALPNLSIYTVGILGHCPICQGGSVAALYFSWPEAAPRKGGVHPNPVTPMPRYDWRLFGLGFRPPIMITAKTRPQQYSVKNNVFGLSLSTSTKHFG